MNRTLRVFAPSRETNAQPRFVRTYEVCLARRREDAKEERAC